MPRCGRKRKKRRTEKTEEVSERDQKQIPRCFVLKRGPVGDRVKDLVRDVRQVMMPNTAKGLRESKLNRMEDFIAVAGHYNVSHLMIFTVTKVATWMKLAKLPQGPTLTFRVDSFSLARDVRASQKRPRGGDRDYTVAPLQVLNGFGGGSSSSGSGQASAPTALTAEMMRGLFPPVDVRDFNYAECRRTALFQYEREEDKLFFRHYSVARKTAGLQRGVSKLLRRARLPKLGRCDDISDFVLGGGQGASESEMEDAEEVPIVGGGRTSIRLCETGPRLELCLVKAEEGVCGGSVIYHRYQTRTPSQIEVLKEKARQKGKLKARNEKLSSMAEGRKGDKRKLEKAKAERQAGGKAEKKDDGSGAEDTVTPDGKKRRVSKNGAGDGEEDAEGETKKKRFHPFGWGAKKTRQASKGEGKTVEFGGSSKQGNRGGAKHRERGDGKKPSVFDKFRQSAKK